ncbi:MAG: hypothetical protein QW837_07770 [Conexivisphaerales archaeon]
MYQFHLAVLSQHIDQTLELRGMSFTEATGLYLYDVVLQQLPPVSSFTETVNQPITEIANYSVWTVQAWESSSGSFAYQTTPTTLGVVFATGGFNSLDFSYGTPNYQGDSYYSKNTVPFKADETAKICSYYALPMVSEAWTK